MVLVTQASPALPQGRLSVVSVSGVSMKEQMQRLIECFCEGGAGLVPFLAQAGVVVIKYRTSL